LTVSNIQHPTFNIQHSTFNIQHSTSNIQHPKFKIQNSTFNLQHSTFNIQPSTFNIKTQMSLFTTHYQSPVGLMRISGSETFISEMVFQDEPRTQSNENSAMEMPALVVQAIEQLIQYFQGQRRVFDLPLHQQGTEFQQKVWHELINIPYGKTVSYLELSRRLGDPKSIRAAASANGKNNICIVVPCHRVIGSNKDLIGYSGGLWRKKWLLALESKIAHGVQTLF
jgi:methylated-DNA-[protein]-cysteine S-methyltransferase